MSNLRFFALQVILLFPVCAAAQHGTAGSGYYPSGYGGDTWSGVVSSVVPATKSVSLVYTRHGKTAFFEGILSKGYRIQTSGDKNKQQIMSTGISVGSHLRVYYLENQTSDDLGPVASFKAYGNDLLARSGNAKTRFNLIFLVQFLPDETESRTGSVIATNDSKREISLAVTDGAKTENFVGVVVEPYQVKMQDGSWQELTVSKIAGGTKVTVQFFDEMTGPDRKTSEVHRIYRIRFLSTPQNP